MVQIFRLLGTRDYKKLNQVGKEVIKTWADHWCVKPELIRFKGVKENRVKHNNQSKEILVSVTHQQDWCTVSAEKSQVFALVAGLFGVLNDSREWESTNSKLIPTIAKRAFSELSIRFLTGTAEVQSEVSINDEDEHTKNHRFGIIFTFQLGATEFDVMVALKVMHKLLETVKPKNVEPLSGHLQSLVYKLTHPVKIKGEAYMGSAALSLKELMSIKKDDVIVLDQKLSDSATFIVKSGKGDISLKCYLGQHSGKRSLKIMGDIRYK